MTTFLSEIIEDKEKELIRYGKRQRDIGVSTVSLNRLPVFEPTLKPQHKERSFENAYGKVFVIGKLGQDHKNLLETILYKRKVYKSYKEKGNRCFEVLYHEYEVRKYMSMSKGSAYSKERYEELIEDMKQAYIKIETKELIAEGNLIADKTVSGIYSKQTKSNLPGLKSGKIPYAVLKLGSVTNLLISEELRFTYDPKPIMLLHSGVSQAIARYIKTHKKHPKGYHLKDLIENIEDNVEGQNWYDIKRLLKKDVEGLGRLGITIDFKKERLYVINNQIML